METEGPSPLSQQHSTCPYPEPDQCSPRPKPISYSSSLILYPHPCLSLPSRFLPRVSPAEPYMHFSIIRATRIARIILLYLVRKVHETSHYSVYFN